MKDEKEIAATLLSLAALVLIAPTVFKLFRSRCKGMPEDPPRT